MVLETASLQRILCAVASPGPRRRYCCAPRLLARGVLPVPRMSLLCLALLSILGGTLFAADPDLSEYRTVDKALTARTARAGVAVAPQPGFLGVHVAADARGRLAVADVA